MRPSLEHPFTPIVAEGQKGDNIDFMTFLRILYVKMLVLFTTPTSALYIFNRNQRRKASSEEQIKKLEDVIKSKDKEIERLSSSNVKGNKESESQLELEIKKNM